MQRRTIRLIIALAVFSIAGIIVTQVYWVQRAFDMKSKQFHQTIHVALRDVAQQIARINQHTVKPVAITQLSSDYFVVNVNDVIDTNVLEHLLKTAFSKRGLFMEYEYGIYDCSTDKMVYGNYISSKANAQPNRRVNLPKYDDYIYYFGVRFPNKTSYLASQMDIWIFLSLILVVVILFFGYTLFAILKQKRLSEVQRDFINNMTHELKTPISTIAITADLLTNPQILDKKDSLINYAHIIKNENARLQTQIEKVLQSARMDKEKLELQKEELVLRPLLEDIATNFELKTKNAGGSLQLRLAPKEVSIWADPNHLINVVGNLLDNALKYAAPHPQIVIITEVIGNTKKKKLHLSIQDNGIGIKKEHQKKIFDKFFRVPTGNIHNVKGFGLGLDYVRQIVQAHGWKISLESESDKGSTFRVVMPTRLTAKDQ
ncbi:sensor histidine kinase KdpD [uncultured Microscilla sp.]|uniref:sensor histidine kinase n=1 Tax=uncultured Microscilla sp. TaxID=432653 RepID=UPI0026165D9D|nr:HAMP domain-containing sensor histidine kinase [uncultured Microscilla sp.]